MKITFDSNVWQLVVEPSSSRTEEDYKIFLKINSLVKENKITPFLSETLFSLEAISKKIRQTFLSNYSPIIKTNIEEYNGGIILNFEISSNKYYHPGNNEYLKKYWSLAKEIGFKIMPSPRIATIINPDIEDASLAPVSDEIMERFVYCGNKIEEKGCGIAHLKKIAEEHDESNIPLIDKIKKTPESKEKKISKAMAEWADGDTVAAHYAYNNKYLCTRDLANNAGQNSIFSPSNRVWLKQEFNIELITPEQLAEMF